MSKYRKKVICPLDSEKLSWGQLVETRSHELYTYHCQQCDTYWHVEWIKKTTTGKNWVWDYKRIYDDFGKIFEKVLDI